MNPAVYLHCLPEEARRSGGESGSAAGVFFDWRSAWIADTIPAEGWRGAASCSGTVSMHTSRVSPPIIGTLAALWGIGGVLLLLGSAIFRLTPVARDAFTVPFHWYHWVALAANILFMAYAEGYRAFQKGFSPRVAARARYLRDHPKFLHALLAPLFCMAFFHASWRRRIVSFSVTLGIIALVLLVRLAPQPWRGITDAGVVIGLLWGSVSLAAFGVAALTGKVFRYSPEVPGGEEAGCGAEA